MHLYLAHLWLQPLHAHTAAHTKLLKRAGLDPLTSPAKLSNKATSLLIMGAFSSSFCDIKLMTLIHTFAEMNRRTTGFHQLLEKAVDAGWSWVVGILSLGLCHQEEEPGELLIQGQRGGSVLLEICSFRQHKRGIPDTQGQVGWNPVQLDLVAGNSAHGRRDWSSMIFEVPPQPKPFYDPMTFPLAHWL